MPASLSAHPEREEFRERVAALGRAWDRPGGWDLFRFVSPRFSSAADVVSGEGARRSAGRWHLPGRYRLSYTSMEPETALAEMFSEPRHAQRPLHGVLPKVLVGVRLEAGRVLDSRAEELRRTLGISLGAIRTTDWRDENGYEGREALTQAWEAAFEVTAFEAVIAPSAATGDGSGSNALVFPDHLRPNSRFRVTSEVRWP